MVAGNAGGQIGAADRWSMQGMKNGTILIDGPVGPRSRHSTPRGIIVIKGLPKRLCGLQMKGGTIVLVVRNCAPGRG